jgi:hypothetical protein
MELSVALCQGNASLCRSGAYVAMRASGWTPYQSWRMIQEEYAGSTFGWAHRHGPIKTANGFPDPHTTENEVFKALVCLHGQACCLDQVAVADTLLMTRSTTRALLQSLERLQGPLLYVSIAAWIVRSHLQIQLRPNAVERP